MTQLTDHRSDGLTDPHWLDNPAPETATATADGVAPPDGPVGPLGPAARRREPRGPRWTGVVAVGAGAAILSSLLTAGALGQFHGTTTTSAATAPATTSASTPTVVTQSTPAVTGGATSPNWQAVAARVEPSVVSVRVVASDGTGDEGSGVILDTQGHVLTNNHVVAAATTGTTLSVVLSDGRSYAATVVGTDSSTDLAVLKITNAPSGLTPATFGNSATVQVGDPVMAIGNPLGLADSVTTGIVSALNRPVTTDSSDAQQSDPQFATTPQSEQVVTNAIQTDAAINPGNSGGALVDSGGRVIAITSSIASLGSSSTSSSQAGSIGLGFAIPSNEAKDVANQLITTGTVKHAYLGVTLSDGTASVNGAQYQAAVIGTLTAGGPASAAGLVSGDAVIAVNGTVVDGSDSLVAQVRAMRPGTAVQLTVVRSGRERNVTVTLAARPAGA